jgi:ATP-grasp in the biosynthetic pathway with Ter operon
MRVWFNKTFSSVSQAFRLIRGADAAGDYLLWYTHTDDQAPPRRDAHCFEREPGGLAGAAYLDWCLAFCRTRDIGIFVPGKEAGLISGERARFEAQGTRVLCAATRDVLRLLHDKARFCALVDLPQAPPAVFRVFENSAQFDAAYAQLSEQFDVLCVKPSQSVYGLGFAVLDKTRNSAQLLFDGAAFRVGLGDFRRGLAMQDGCRTMLLMEYLGGAEYSVDCVGDNGRLVCAVPRKKPGRAGAGQTIVPDPVVLAAAARLAAAYGLNGNFNVQFREADGRPRLLEINARMSGGIAMACLAGPNLPYLALRGFDRGYAGLEIPAVRAGIRVGEQAYPVEYL